MTEIENPKNMTKLEKTCLDITTFSWKLKSFPAILWSNMDSYFIGPSVGAWTGTLKNPTKFLWRWKPVGPTSS